jgi:hypothetical protein
MIGVVSIRSNVFPFTGTGPETGNDGHLLAILTAGADECSEVCFPAQPCLPWLRQHAGN